MGLNQYYLDFTAMITSYNSMYALFIERGIFFNKGIVAPPHENINVYPMLYHN